MRCLLDADVLAWLAEAAFKALRLAWPVEVAAFDAQTGAAPSP